MSLSGTVLNNLKKILMLTDQAVITGGIPEDFPAPPKTTPTTHEAVHLS